MSRRMEGERARFVDCAFVRTKQRLGSAMGALTLLTVTMVGCSSAGRSPVEMTGFGGRSDGGASGSGGSAGGAGGASDVGAGGASESDAGGASESGAGG